MRAQRGTVAAIVAKAFKQDILSCAIGRRVGNSDGEASRGRHTGVTKRQTALACLFAVAAGLFWLARPAGENAAAVAMPPAQSPAAMELGDRPWRPQDVSADLSPHSGPARNERQPRDRGGVALNDAPSPPVGVPDVGALPELEPRDPWSGLRSWWDDVERWRYAEEARPDLRGRDFGNADLKFVDLANADLRGADLEDANLHGADLRGADLQGAVIRRTYLYGMVLRNAVLRGTAIGPANISATDLRGADLRGVRIVCRNCSTWSLLMSSDFGGADLRQAHFGASHISGSAFDEADLRGANLAETEGVPRSLRGALYDRHTKFPERIEPKRWGMVYVPDAAAQGG